MKKILLLPVLAFILVSCASQKDLEEAKRQVEEARKSLRKETEVNGKLRGENKDLIDKLKALNEKASSLKVTNQILLDNMGNLSALTKKGADNLEKSLESLREKDLKISSLQDAISKKDSVTFAVVKSLKGSLGDMDDEDISISIEKGVVFISISDKMIFNSGSYKVTSRAKKIISKVAKVVKDKPDFDFVVEGHTDNVPVSTSCISDNWDLSVMRATSIVRLLQKDYGVEPSRMSASGRSYYMPIADNSTKEGKSVNRRIKIILIPKINQFYGMVEESLGLK